MTGLSRKELIAIGLGIVLSALPLLAFNAWLDRFIEWQGEEEVKLAAQRSLALTDTRIARTIEGLRGLARRGVDSCSPRHLEALRRTNFNIEATNEWAVIGPDGQTLCTDHGLALGPRRSLTPSHLLPTGDVTIELIGIGETLQMVRLRQVGQANANTVAALIPPHLLVPQVSSRGEASHIHARILLPDGSVFVERGSPPVGKDSTGDFFTSSMASARHGLTAKVWIPRRHTIEHHRDLRTLGTLVTSLAALAVIGVALLVPARRRGDPIAEIERALKAGEFVPYYQPVVDITTGRLCGGEVLVRWRKPDGSMVLPGSFVPLLESSDLIVELTRDLMKRVREEVGTALAGRPHLRVSFNVAARHFADEAIVRDVREIFDDSLVPLKQVVLELTERQPLENLTETRRVVAALQGLGARIAIDDIGTGHSGLSYMLKLGADIIKIDKLFVDAIGDLNSKAIIGTLIDLAQNMRMDIVAEGVETFEQVVYLREMGIRAAQGYVFAPPLPGSSFLQLIEAIDPLPREQRTEEPAGRFMSGGNRFTAV